MATFTDKLKREWVVEITIGDLGRLKAAGLSVADAGKDLSRVGRSFMADPDAFGRALWTLVEKQAAKEGVDVGGFLDGIDGPAAFRAIQAMEEAVVNFSQNPTAAAKILEMLPAARQRESQAINKMVGRKMSQAIEKIDGLIESASNSEG